MLHKQYYIEQAKVDSLIGTHNEKSSFYNGIYDRYKRPVLTREFIPVHWRYDLDAKANPYFMERLGVNAVMNSGAIYLNGKYCLVVRVEGNDRKSFFAVAESESGIDGFRFRDYAIELPDTCPEETNVYDMRLTQHEDGWIYGVFCSESKDRSNPDLSAAVAAAGIVRTKDLQHWERLDNLKTLHSPQQRNVALHPEFVNGKYAFYTRPMDGFIETGSGGGIGFGLCDNIEHAVIDRETIISRRIYHTITEAKNGAGAVPIKGKRCWIHIAHGVRNTAAGLRYVLYAFGTDLKDPSMVIAEPSGVFLVPLDGERVGDVSNVVFTNGAIARENGDVYIYYASCDTRMHVATTTIDRLEDYLFKTPGDPLRSADCVHQRNLLIQNNLNLLVREGADGLLAGFDRKELVYTGRVDFHDQKHPEWVFPATSIHFRFYGKSASLWVTNRNAYWKNTLGAIVDGAQLRFDLNDTGETEIRLVAEDIDCEHDVLVFKRMDSCHEVVLERLELSDGSRLLPAPRRSARRIEVYGDSVSAGEVSEAVHCTGKPDPVHNGEFSNSWYSYAWLTARKLGAELHDIAQGGIALLDNTGWFEEPNAIGMESVWNKLHYHPHFGKPTEWDFSLWTPQIVIVAFGQNDSHPEDYMAADPEGERAQCWRTRYKVFLEKLRETYPEAHIICCTTLLGHDPAWDLSIGQVCRELDDEKITQYLFHRNGRGTPGHLRIPEAEEMAEELAAYIESLHVKGWE